MKYLTGFLLLVFQFAYGQKLKKADKTTLAALEAHVKFLADDQLAGRRTGSAGEKLAYEYISNAFEKAGILPKGDNGTYLQAFEVNEGMEVQPASHLIVNGNDLRLNEDYFPFAFSRDTALQTTASIALQESGSAWFYDVRELVDANKNNPHYDLATGIREKAEQVAKKGANAFIVFNSSAVDDQLKFEPRSAPARISIPVLYVSRAAHDKYMKDETATLDLDLKIMIAEKKRTGHNVVGMIDNHVPNTVVLGAHYDHLGYGEDHNSLYTGSTPQVHNGADDNASGTAALIELAKMLKAGKLRSNNYLFIAFSGEELGLFGSKYFTEHPTVDLSSVNYMVNMDMIGRLNDSTHRVSIGGFGTSPAWSGVFAKKDKYFEVRLDSSGSGPSDHTSFYRKGIPVLFVFTGTHPDYHKPTDDADRINYLGELQVLKWVYGIIEKMDKQGKLEFTQTRETQMSAGTSFKVTLGIMPDYTFSENGVRADAVIDGRPAQKAGMKAGDIIVQMGEYPVSDLQGYMNALNKFEKGQGTKVTIKRASDTLVLDVVF